MWGCSGLWGRGFGREDHSLPSDMWGYSKIQLQLWVSDTHRCARGCFSGRRTGVGCLVPQRVRAGHWGPQGCSHSAFPTQVDASPGRGWGTPPPPRTLIFLFSVWSCFHLQGKGELLEDFQSSLWHSGRQLGGAGQTWGAPVSASIHTWRAGVK